MAKAIRRVNTSDTRYGEFVTNFEITRRKGSY
jgi:hypothetical protein